MRWEKRGVFYLEMKTLEFLLLFFRRRDRLWSTKNKKIKEDKRVERKRKSESEKGKKGWHSSNLSNYVEVNFNFIECSSFSLSLARSRAIKSVNK